MHQDNKDILTIKNWNPVFKYVSSLEQQNCAICRSELIEQCIDCSGSGNNEECKVSKGVCEHQFHYHCIFKWNKNKHTCPLCNEQIYTKMTFLYTKNQSLSNYFTNILIRQWESTLIE
ncbi:hypothetical protein PPERSA_02470 [Pseudocohnilembus persalinus]|uniref:RING-type domain-containing protein n=1 Tax=Pseudocohnilembus persalinus TaxID=266149 RepID=A0A0V0QAV9_PSEPJ|nr:hypothetical protein PPERSA_02470 [Pseudocohnilembus persalinus]|eukprot:KRW99358.1 hypothetical protein PPERSA_02470 [Pseudocohnilembus persalinus]